MKMPIYDPEVEEFIKDSATEKPGYAIAYALFTTWGENRG